MYFILSEEEILKKVIKLFCSFLTTQEKVEKYVELTEKTPEAKIMMSQVFLTVVCLFYNIEILNLLTPNCH